MEDLMRIMLRAGLTPNKFDHDLKKPFTKAGKLGLTPKELRPITLLCEILKMLEAWLHSILIEHFKGSEEQAGFKKGYSCVGRLFVLHTLVRKVILKTNAL